MALDLETREQLLEMVRRFVSDRLRPLEERVAEEDAVPEEVLAEMRELGLFGLSVPEEYGGLDLSMEDECLVAIEMGKTSPAFRSSFGTNVGIGSQGLIMFGTEEQKEKWLPGIASGEFVTSFALTEPDAGSDSAAVNQRPCAGRRPRTAKYSPSTTAASTSKGAPPRVRACITRSA
jgi:acyl-CoA dehydrogenase